MGKWDVKSVSPEWGLQSKLDLLARKFPVKETWKWDDVSIPWGFRNRFDVFPTKSPWELRRCFSNSQSHNRFVFYLPPVRFVSAAALPQQDWSSSCFSNEVLRKNWARVFSTEWSFAGKDKIGSFHTGVAASKYFVRTLGAGWTGVSAPEHDRNIFRRRAVVLKISGPQHNQIVWSCSGPVAPGFLMPSIGRHIKIDALRSNQSLTPASKILILSCLSEKPDVFDSPHWASCQIWRPV